MVGVERVVGVDRVGVDQVDAAADTDPLSKVLGASRAIHNVQHLLLRIGTFEIRQKFSKSVYVYVFQFAKKNFQTSYRGQSQPNSEANHSSERSERTASFEVTDGHFFFFDNG